MNEPVVGHARNLKLIVTGRVVANLGLACGIEEDAVNSRILTYRPVSAAGVRGNRADGDVFLRSGMRKNRNWRCIRPRSPLARTVRRRRTAATSTRFNQHHRERSEHRSTAFSSTLYGGRNRSIQTP